ncbi:MAG: ParB N-terminal domain-containing protein [Myxococcales bacterium]|nr:ParB N-terminal domain-containing protein [Myxococcales bacterium]
MREIFERLKVVPMADVLVHEGVVDRQVARISDYVQHDGVMKNPIVVAEVEDETNQGGHYIVLDGMHRVQAMSQLGCRDILVFVAEYWSTSIRLKSWDALLLDPVDPKALITELFSKDEVRVGKVRTEEQARERIYGRDLAMAFTTRGGETMGVRVLGDEGSTLSRIVHVLTRIEEKFDELGTRVVYAPSSKSGTDLAAQDASVLFLRPLFSKQEVLQRTLAGKLFPRKSTRFLVPERPLRVDFHLTVLQADLDLAIKNQLLDGHLRWCWENNKVRYYPEPVFVFGD